MEQSLSWEAVSSSGIQEISRLLRDSKVHLLQANERELESIW
jgi:hypothetical protein